MREKKNTAAKQITIAAKISGVFLIGGDFFGRSLGLAEIFDENLLRGAGGGVRHLLVMLEKSAALAGEL